MSAKVFEQVSATLDRLIKIEPGDAPGGAGDESVGLGQDNRRLIESLNKTGGHNTDHSLVPRGVIHYRGSTGRQGRTVLYHLQGFLGDLAVDSFTLVVVVVDALAYNVGDMVVCRGQKLDGKPSSLHTACGVDPRADLEDNVVYRKMARFKLGKSGHRQQALAGILIELLEAEMSQDPVLPDHSDKISGDAHDQQIQKRNQGLERDAIFL